MIFMSAWWRHQMETFSALLALCVGNSLVNSEFPTQKPVRRSFDVFFDLHLNKRLSKQLWGWWFENPSRSLCHWNGRSREWKLFGINWRVTTNIINNGTPYIILFLRWLSGAETQLNRRKIPSIDPRSIAVVLWHHTNTYCDVSLADCYENVS